MNIPERIDSYQKNKAAKAVKEVIAYLERRRDLEELLEPYKSEAPIYVNNADFPLKIVHVGDTHIAHDDSDPHALEEAVKESEGSPLLLQGNIIDSVSSKFISTNTTRIGLNLPRQELLAHAILKPALDEKRVIAVGKNMCHEGWPVKTSTHDPLDMIVDPGTPRIFTGGQVVLYDRKTRKRIGVAELYHNSGKGRTNLSPEGSIRARSREIPAGHPQRPNLVVDAHMHQLFAGQDIFRSPVLRKDITTSFGEVGAAKGSQDRPDEFLIGIGVPPRNQPADAGQGFASIWRKGEKNQVSCYPVAGYNRGNRLYEALKLRDSAASVKGTLDDLKGIIFQSDKFSKPKMMVDESGSEVRVQDSAAKSEGIAPLYKTLSERIKTTLPISIQFIGNLRIGSNSFERKRLEQVLSEIENNPWSYYVATRRLVNQGVPKRIDRESILVDLAATLGIAKSSLLAIMLTDDLRNNTWGMKVKAKGESAEKIYPGDWLYYTSQLAKTPLILPETVLSLTVGRTPFTIYLRDKLSHFTSLINPLSGLTRVQQVWGIDADALVGGHTEVVGWRTWMRPWGQLEIVVPGGFAEYMEKGIGNRVDYPEGAQGMILLSSPRKMLYSFASHNEGRDMHEALWLHEGLRQLRILPAMKEKISRKK